MDQSSVDRLCPRPILYFSDQKYCESTRSNDSLDSVIYIYFQITLGLRPGKNFWKFWYFWKFLIFHLCGNNANNYEKIISDVYFGGQQVLVRRLALRSTQFNPSLDLTLSEKYVYFGAKIMVSEIENCISL